MSAAPDRSEGQDPGPYPDPRSAFFLSLWAFLASGFVAVFFIQLGTVAAIGIGQTLAVGTIATLAARRVAEPQADRIGLRAFDVKSLPMVLCLVPVALLASELDNWAYGFSPGPTTSATYAAAGEADSNREADSSEPGSTELERPEAATDAEVPGAARPETGADRDSDATAPNPDLPDLSVDLEDPWIIAQAFVISVGITPIVEEFFFRGVIQQSVVARMGLARGVGFTALLYTLPHLPAVASAPRFLVGTISAFGIGYLLGLVRLATGSILASILLASMTAGVGILSFALRDRFPLPGMNVEGTHLPILVTAASLIIVGWAAQAIFEEAKVRVAKTGDP